MKNKKCFSGSHLSSTGLKGKGFSYSVASDISDYSQDKQAIVVPVLFPNLFLVFGNIKLIISEKGSYLSHIAILAREQNIPVLLLPEVISKIDEKGTLDIDKDEVCFYSNN